MKDISKPIVDLDRKLKTGIMKSLRGIRESERKLEKGDSKESEVAKDYLAAIRSVLLEDGNSPLDLPGIRIIETQWLLDWVDQTYTQEADQPMVVNLKS